MYRRMSSLGEMILLGYISLAMGRWFGLLGIVCFVAGWYCIVYYPPVLRTVIFWTMCFVAGVSLLGMTLFLGSYTPIMFVFVVFFLLSVQFLLWSVVQAKKYPWDYQERRYIISTLEDFILYHAGAIMWICLACIGFLEKGGTFDMDGKVISMDTFLQFLIMK